MIIEINVSDEINPAIKRLLNHSKGYLKHVTKSLGYMYQDETKKAVGRGAPNGETYPKRIDYKIRKALSPSAREEWYGLLRQAIGYEYLGHGSVAIGWTSPTATKYGHLQERGFSRNITSAVRRKWASVGYPLPASKTQFNIPARPVFTPMARQIRPQIVPYVEDKVLRYMNENVEYGKKKNERRVYKVYK